MTEAFNIDDIQGNILRGYRSHFVRHLILEVTDKSAACRFLGVAVDGGSDTVPAITRATEWIGRPVHFFNIGVTYEGLRALGLPSAHLATFPTEFVEGMTKRAMKIGDFGDSAPDNWPAPFDQPERVHIVASVYSNEESELDEVEQQVAAAFDVIGVRNGRGLGKDKVFFDYTDNISQPRFKGITSATRARTTEPDCPLGTALLGQPGRYEGMMYRVPTPSDLGFNGSFNAFRVLAQDVAGFEAYLDTAADTLMENPEAEHLLKPGDEGKIGKGFTRHQALREIVAAQMCGRWRNGVPYETSPDTPFPDPEVSLTDFDYDRKSRCPVGAHTRRANPRGGPIVQRIANYSRRLIRRGMPYGPDFDPGAPDDAERGLLGNFIGANLGAQFEAVMCDWLNLGLQNPNITGANDPLLGANTPETSWFDLTLGNGGTIRLRGFPRFVQTRGGAYTFLPSMKAIRYLSQL